MSELSACDVWSVEASYPSVLGQGRPLIDQIVAEMEKRAWSGRDVFAVNLALEEAFTNAIEHGNNCDPRKEFHVKCEVSPKRVSIVIRDEGEGFKRESVPNPLEEENMEIPSGRGVLLIFGFMTSVTYNDKGNEITMIKEPSPEESPAQDEA
ncbi:MAG: ATP-binding protein [Thermoguttaceae bacterium]|nr:ATP-binding protein [Thermoguttaceae bacterium]MBQ6618991.1 ATP-binding protein [Thermoguttaceae bacterium]MBR2585294.1 ATP-binding protein [Thermoguttaceae bacterium]MBR3219555.1 ATP-binding protein [Thermoguttaceae bacterium]